MERDSVEQDSGDSIEEGRGVEKRGVWERGDDDASRNTALVVMASQRWLVVIDGRRQSLTPKSGCRRGVSIHT